MLINENIMRKIKNYAGPTRCNKAKDYQRDGRVIINKIMYGDKFNYSIDADVRGNYGNYNTYINIENGDLEDFECTCEDYYNNYNICKHIVATALEINSSSQYDVSMKDNKDLKYNDFKEIIGEFYNDIMGQDETDAKYGEDYGKVIIKPKLIIHSYNSEVKVEFKIGTKKQLYKLKDIPEFYRNMNEKKLFKYGLKLEFLHDEDAFLQEYKPMLNFLLKYASIMNSVKRTTNMGYRYFGQSINYSSIALDANGVDELFEIINDDVIEVETDFGTIKMIYLNSSPDIKFEINKINNKEYSITPTNVSAFKHYEILKGKENIYMVLDISFL